MVIVRTDKSNILKVNVAAAIFCALAYASEYLFHVKVLFLTFDIKDSIIAIAAMIFGPVYAVMMGFAVALLELITMSDTGPYGFVMNVLSTVTFTAVSSLIYRKVRTLYGAVLGFVTGAVAMTAVMMMANLFITPYYMTANGTPTSMADIVAMIPKVLLPFNLLKAIFNASIAMLLYKHVVNALRRARILPRKITSGDGAQTNVEQSKRSRIIRTVAVTAGAVLVAAVSILILVFGLDAKISWF